MTRMDLRGEVRELKRQQRREAASRDADHYDVLLIDPAPWPEPLDPQAIEQLTDLEPGRLAAEDAVLFLWVPAGSLPDGVMLLDVWGFQYRSSMVWVKEEDGKPQLGRGWWFRHQHELLLMATRSEAPEIPPKRRPPSVLKRPRRKQHEKPPEARALIEYMLPQAKRLDLMPRGEVVPGWDRPEGD
jgi:N6-adenosine-specific RNA methylase IME4